MANLPPRLRATAPVFTPPSNPHVRPRLRPTAKPFEPAVYLSTPQPPTASPVLEPYPQLEEYIHLAHFCCKSVAPDPDDEKDGEGFEAFLDRCYRHINSYPTLQELRAYIKTKPLTQTISRSQDWHPNLDEGIRWLAGWDANGAPDFVGTLRAVQKITEKGRTTKQRFPGSVLISPSRAVCGRANALSAYVNYMFAWDLQAAGVGLAPSERYHGPPSHEWQFFLVAVAHAADAARQKMLSPVVLSIGYAFRDIANRLGCNLQNGEFFTPLLLALRQHHGCDISQDARPPPDLVLDEYTCEQLRHWVTDISQDFKNRPDPYWDGKPTIPLSYTPWEGVLND